MVSLERSRCGLHARARAHVSFCKLSCCAGVQGVVCCSVQFLGLLGSGARLLGGRAHLKRDVGCHVHIWGCGLRLTRGSYVRPPSHPSCICAKAGHFAGHKSWWGAHLPGNSRCAERQRAAAMLRRMAIACSDRMLRGAAAERGMAAIEGGCRAPLRPFGKKYFFRATQITSTQIS